MNKPLYEIGDTIDCWQVIRASQFYDTYIYSLHHKLGGHFVTVDEPTLISWIERKLINLKTA